MRNKVVCLSLAVLAGAASAADVGGTAATVRQLIQEDARRALAAARGQNEPDIATAPAPVPIPAPTMQVPRVAPHEDMVELLALYGVEPHLTALVSINGRNAEYRTWGPKPQARASGYELVAVVGDCIELRKVTSPSRGKTRTACYQPAVLTDAAPAAGQTASGRFPGSPSGPHIIPAPAMK